MKLIAHRGLTEGPDKEKENDPYQINKAISEGFDCEIDLWRIIDGINSGIYLGHDYDKHKVTFEWLINNKSFLWIHAKNIEALYFLTEFGFNCFWHENDKFTLTSCGWIWTFPGNVLTENSVCVMPEQYMKNLYDVDKLKCYGICSDYISTIKMILEDN